MLSKLLFLNKLITSREVFVDFGLATTVNSGSTEKEYKPSLCYNVVERLSERYKEVFNPHLLSIKTFPPFVYKDL